MKTLFKNRVIPIILVISVAFTLMAIPVSAVNCEEKDLSSTSDFPSPTKAQIDELSDSDWTIINDMTRSGIISFEQAYHIFRVDKIVDKLEQHNQVVTSVDGKIVVLPASDGINHLTDMETEFIIDALSQEMQKINDDRDNLLSYEEAVEVLQTEMIENPGLNIYSVDMGAGHILSASISTENILTETDNSFTRKALAAGEYGILGTYTNPSNTDLVSTPFSLTANYSEEEILSERVLIFEDGRYSKTYELTQSSGISYSSNSVSVITEYTNDAHEASMDTLRPLQAAYGVITIANASASIVVPTTSYYENPTEWCEAVNQVIFTTTASITLGGIFSFSVNGSWTQLAIIRSSIVAIHAYAGVYY